MATGWNLGLTTWKPNEGKRKRLLADVVDVLDRWVGSGELPAMTARALLYRLLPLGWKKNDDRDLEYVLKRARRSGLIPFEWIADGRSEHYRPSVWASAEAFKASWQEAATDFRLDRLTGQPNIEVWVETAGMLQMLEALADELSVILYCSSGFNTLTAKYDAAQRLIGNYRRGTVIVFVGDLDPWGEARYLNVRNDVLAIAADLIVNANRGDSELSREEVLQRLEPQARFVTAALTREQVVEHGIPTDPAQPKKDKRTGVALLDKLPHGWRVGDPTAQAEALPPNVLLGAIRDRVSGYIDAPTLDKTLADEQRQRDALVRAIETSHATA